MEATPESAGLLPPGVATALMRGTFDAVVVLDEHRRPVGANAAALELLGAGAELVAGLMEQSRTGFAEGWQRLEAGEARWRGEASLLLADQRPRHGEVQLIRRGSPTEFEGAIALWRDTSRRQDALERYRSAEARLQEAQRIARLGSWELELDTSSLHWSDETYRIHDLPVGAQVSLADAINFYSQRSRPLIQAAYEACRDRGEPFDLELQIRTAAGRVIWVRSKGQALREEGRITRLAGVFQDVDDLKRSRLEGERFAERLRMAAEAAGMGVWEWDAATGELFWDAVQQDLHGLENATALSLTDWLGLVHADDREEVQIEFERAAQGDEDLEVVFRIQRTDGRERRLRVAARRHADASTGAVRLIGVTLDITNAHERQVALEWAREQSERANHELRQAILRAERSAREADSANRAKSEFLAVMSHEIRTPMNGVLGFAEILSMMDLSDEQNEYVDTIRESGASLLHLIDDILDYSKIESGRMELEEGLFVLSELLEDVVRLNEPKASENLVRIDLEIAPELSNCWIGDAIRLRQILMNLLGNACKFTRQGKVLIRVRSVPFGNGLLFEVKDTGIGIDSEAMARLFLPFSQADSSTTRRFGGTGLGLAICKRLVELMGGRIWVDSRPGEGSSFQFSLPLNQGEESGKVPTAAPDAEPARVREGGEFAGLRALLVEDNPVNRRLASLLIKRMGFQLDEAVDGFAGLERLISNRYDLVFMDIQMPGLDGVEVTRRVRNNPQLQQPLILAVTAFAMDGDRERFLEAGMDGYVSKPVTGESLGDAVRSVLSLNRNRGAVTAEDQPSNRPRD